MRAVGVLAACAVCVPQAVPADEPERDEPRRTHEEEPVEVRARAPWIEDLAAFASEVDAEEAARRGLDVRDLLPRVPSARVSSYGGVGQFASVSLRGSSADQVTVRVDGVPQNRALGGAVDLSTLPASQIETITVFRGFPPAAAGLSGLGGLVEIRTKRPREGQSGQVDVLAGSLGTRRLAASWSGGRSDGAGLRLGVEALETDGDFRFVSDNGTPENPEDDHWAERINNDVRAVDLVASASGLRSWGGELSVSARLRDADRGIPGVDALQSPDARLDGQRATVHAAWDWEASRGGGARLLIDGFSQEDHLRDDGLLGVGAGFQDQTTRITGGGAALTVRRAYGGHRLLGRFELRGERARVRDEVLDPVDRGGARRWLGALVVEDVFSVAGWTLAPSVRWELQDDSFVPAGSGAVAPVQDGVREAHWSGKLGIARPIGGGWSLRGSVGRYVKVPSLEELFGDRGLVRGNPELVPESGEKLEIGVESGPRTGTGSGSGSARRRWQLSVVAFASRTDDLIWFVPLGIGTVKAQNIAAAEAVGVEATASVRLSPRLWVDASGTWQRVRDVSEGYTHERQLVGRPERLGYLGVRWRPGRWRVDYDLAYVGENYTDRLNTEEGRLPARAMHDVSIGRELGGGITVGVEVRNLLDQQARDVWRYPLPGRMVLARVGWRFGGGR
jgi:iron complex outermembrane receptor protein